MNEIWEQTTTKTDRMTQLPDGVWYVIAILDGETTRYLLPISGKVIIGRGKKADIVIDHVSVSRMHACLNLDDKVTLVDLGSSNGTTIRDMTLEANQPVEVFSNDVIDIGTAMLVIRKTRQPSIPTLDTYPEILTRLNEDSQIESRKVVVVSEEMHRIHRLIERIAESDLSVLLLGETGVGKEVLAERVHACSKRATKRLVCINCAAFPDTLLESELFGYSRGAFSGAEQDKPGLLESGDGGTVFIDEVGDMPLPVQVKLLRAIGERKVLRIGSTKPRAIDVRFVSATNKNLEEMIERGEFREDFYYRLNGISIQIPSLRERPEEIQPIAENCVHVYSQRQQLKQTPRISQSAMDLLCRYPWPGNVRELRNIMERAVVLCEGVIEPEHLPTALMTRHSNPSQRCSVDVRAFSVDEQAERRLIIETLDSCTGNQSKTSEKLGISRSTLIRRLNRYAIPRPRKK